MKKVTWGIDQEVYDYLKKQAAETGLSVQQTANLILKRYSLDIKIAPVEEKRKRGNPDFLKKETFYIVARTFDEYQRFLKEKGLSPKYAVEVDSIQRLRGLYNPKVVWLSGANRRSDYNELFEYVNALNRLEDLEKGGQ